MHVVDSVVHDSGGDVSARDALRPGRLHIQVELGLAAILTRVFLRENKQKTQC